MGQAKVVSLRVRPKYASHLCFEVNGILDQLNTDLGKTVIPFDFTSFFQTLYKMPTSPDLSLLSYNPLKIQADTQSSALASLRSEDIKAALQKAINNRQNTYFAKYANKDLPARTTASGAPTGGIIATMRQYYDPNVYHSKPDLLSKLTQNSQDQWDQVSSSYSHDPRRTGPLKTGVNTLCSDVTGYGYSAASGVVDGLSAVFSTGNQPGAAPPLPGRPWEPPIPWPPTPPTQALSPPVSVITSDFKLPLPSDGTAQQTTNYQTISSSDKAHQEQTITPSDYGYRIPMIESGAQYHRAQISLLDQRFAQFMFGQNLPHLETVFTNELNSIDLDVYRLQTAYLRTFLMLPASLLPQPARGQKPSTAVVTGIYKRPGEAVRAGEPVIRVESTDTVLLEGTLVYPGRIVVGSTVQLTTNLFDSGAPIPPITGSTVAVRGRRNDDQWEVIVECRNLDARNVLIFPLGYHFDYDDTTVSIS
jgi:hypothetical protein